MSKTIKAKAKPIKAKPKVVKAKAEKKEIIKKKKSSLSSVVYKSITETLEHNVLGGGEFHLPSILTRVLDKSAPGYNKGLHRESYIPISGVAPFYRQGDPQLIDFVLRTQAGIVLHGLVETGFKFHIDENVDIPLCKECST